MRRFIAGNRASVALAIALAAVASAEAETLPPSTPKKPKKVRKLGDLKTGKARL